MSHIVFEGVSSQFRGAEQELLLGQGNVLVGCHGVGVDEAHVRVALVGVVIILSIVLFRLKILQGDLSIRVEPVVGIRVDDDTAVNAEADRPAHALP